MRQHTMHRWELGRQDRISTHASAVLTRAVVRTSLLKVANCALCTYAPHLERVVHNMLLPALTHGAHYSRKQGKKQSSIQVALQHVVLALKKANGQRSTVHVHCPTHTHHDTRRTCKRRASTRTPHSFRHTFGQLVEWQVLPCCVTRAYTAMQNVCARALYLLHPRAYMHECATTPTHCMV
jgi:hypothetical protein